MARILIVDDQENARGMLAEMLRRYDIMVASVERGLVDGERVGTGGWSYGGILTNHVITRTDRFKAACTGASTFIYVSNYGHDQYQRWWEFELGLPWENTELWIRISPFFRVGDVTTPTLVMCGQEDWNVPLQNSDQLYQALRRRGVPRGRPTRRAAEQLHREQRCFADQ